MPNAILKPVTFGPFKTPLSDKEAWEIRTARANAKKKNLVVQEYRDTNRKTVKLVVLMPESML